MPAASSIYWDSVDSQRSSGASSGSSRHYVDPWDLENYAYLRRHSIAAPPQHSTPAQQQQRPHQQHSHQQKQQSSVVRRRRSHEQRLEPEVEYWWVSENFNSHDNS